MKLPFFSQFKKELEERFDFGYLFSRLKYEKQAIDAFLATHPLVGNPKFSIIVPTYGIAPLYLKECFDSIERQTYSNWEICVCNDADPLAKSAEFVRLRNEKTPNRFKLSVHPKNLGICEATRTALKLADGDFVVFMDADDVLHPRALESLARAISSSDVDFVYSNHDHMTDWGLRIRPMLKPGWSPELLMHVNYINHLTCIRRALLENHEVEFFPHFSVGAQDWDLCLKMVLYARRVKHVPLILYHWRARPGSMAEHPTTKPWAIRNQLEVRRRITPFLGEKVQFDTENWKYRSSSDSPIHLFSFQNGESMHQLLDRLTILIGKEKTGTVIFFSDPPIADSLKNLIAYAKLSHVACVWPFIQSALRTAYTVGGDDCLVPVNSSRSTFSNYSANVLTGPLNGLVIEIKKLREIVTWINSDISKSEMESLVSKAADPNALGALMGLVSIILKYRNMSANGAVVPQVLNPIYLSPTILPATDSYL